MFVYYVRSMTFSTGGCIRTNIVMLGSMATAASHGNVTVVTVDHLTKGTATKRVKAPYKPGLDMVYPDL